MAITVQVAAVLLLVAEFVLNTVIIHKVQYTEIDWVAYMQVGASRGDLRNTIL